MYKKIGCFIVLLVICLCLSSCGESAYDDEVSYARDDTYFRNKITFEDGSYCYEGTYNITYQIKTLPFSLEKNGLKMDLIDLQYYEVYSPNSHGYDGYVIAVFDRTSISEDDIYWMRNSQNFSREFDVNAYYRESDSTDSEGILAFQSSYDPKYWFFIFRTKETSRYPLESGEISIQAIWQSTDEDIKDSYFYYDLEIDSSADYSDLSRLPTYEIDAITSAMIDAVE